MKRAFSLAAVAATALCVLAQPTAAAQPVASVTGSITLDEFGNSITVSAREYANGEVSGFFILESGAGLRGRSHTRIRVEVTCLEVVGSHAVVGGTTVRASPTEGTVFPRHAVALEDNGPQQPDRWMLFSTDAGDPANPCLEAIIPASVPALRGNITIRDGTLS
ncbi:MAG: hypothetical protein M3321_04135 [Actinomycetota bacterium]|nr:hypothetical protein [Actinomycetota bacterium]